MALELSIALLAAPETTPAVLFGLYDVLISVGEVYPDMTARQVGEPLLDVQIVAAEAQPFRCFGNILIEPHAAIDDLERVDAAVVCDMYTPIDTAPRGRYGAEIAWLRRMHADGAQIGSVCSGSLVLAEAGLLDGRQCAGHWAYRDLFRRQYPKVNYCADSILHLESEAECVITAGGVTAWQELALRLISRYRGPEHALQTAKVYLLSGHDDGQLPFADMGMKIQGEDHAIKVSQEWIAEHYAQANPVEAMTQRAGLTRRTFTRRFRAATGHLPMDYVHAVRVEKAKRIIEQDAGGIDDVAYQVGYEDPTFFRRLFKREVGLTPPPPTAESSRASSVTQCPLKGAIEGWPGFAEERDQSSSALRRPCPAAAGETLESAFGCPGNYKAAGDERLLMAVTVSTRRCLAAARQLSPDIS